MQYEQVKKAKTMLKILCGIDIVESACIDFKPTDERDAKMAELIKEAMDVNARIIREYDNMLRTNAQERLCKLYETANRSIDWTIEKFVNEKPKKR